MIPNKSTFKFQELTPITGVKPYVLRFWETEFEEIAPVSGDSGTKLYARKDIEAIFKIKKLLFEEKLSIPQAKSAIKTRDVAFDETANSESVGHYQDQSMIKEAILAGLNLISEIKIKRNW